MIRTESSPALGSEYCRHETTTNALRGELGGDHSAQRVAPCNAYAHEKSPEGDDADNIYGRTRPGRTRPSKRLDKRGRDDDDQFYPVCDFDKIRTMKDAENEPTSTHALSPKCVGQPSEQKLSEQISNWRCYLDYKILVGR